MFSIEHLCLEEKVARRNLNRNRLHGNVESGEIYNFKYNKLSLEPLYVLSVVMCTKMDKAGIPSLILEDDSDAEDLLVLTLLNSIKSDEDDNSSESSLELKQEPLDIDEHGASALDLESKYNPLDVDMEEQEEAIHSPVEYKYNINEDSQQLASTSSDNTCNPNDIVLDSSNLTSKKSENSNQMSTEKLQNSHAYLKLIEIMSQKNRLDKEYYDKKLKLMEEQTSIFKSIATALKQISEKK